MSILRLEQLGKDFPNTKAVDNVTLTVEDGEMLTVVGPSGCGKTTLLRMIAGLIMPTSGKITLGERLLADADHPSRAVMPEDRDIGMVFQSYAVWPHMNVFDNVAYPLKVRKSPKDEIKKQVFQMLRIVHLEGLEKRMTFQLSGGQQQRVALARALVMRPKLLLLDEPLSNLDAALREQMRGEIKEIQRNMGITIVNVTHDQIEAMTMSDKVAVMKEGRLIQYATPYDLYEHPAGSFVAKFIGSGNVIPAERRSSPPDEQGMMEVMVEDCCPVRVPYDQEAGKKGFVSVRAHHLIPTQKGIPATVRRRLYQGNLIEYLLETPGGTKLTMTCPTGFDFSVGESLMLGIERAVWLDE